ncbi:MAG: DUF692 domain-containing protein [Proteobacteria bacterium]|nr:DUF692 domain-containing protein [Pseudomonadota bacterium]
MDKKTEHNKSNNRPNLGFGLGLRTDHYDEILSSEPNVDWFEIISENYMVSGGKPLYYLDQFKERYPLVMHGVSMTIGTTDPLNMDYLKDLKKLAARIQPSWISDHLCWTSNGGHNTHDLMPMPYNEESLTHVVSRVKRVQDYLGCQILLENASSYITYKESNMTEWDFLSEIAEEADCLLLLDVNNIYVSGFNHGFDPKTYIDRIPSERIWQIHLAGHENNQNYLIDTHDHPVIDDVWELYDYALSNIGAVSTMIERDDHIPPLAELVAELDKARVIGSKYD